MLKTVDELKIEGWRALVEKLGVTEATRYILQYQKGSGDYTNYRREYFKDITLDEIVTELDKKKTKGE